jgi:arylsulfatase A-like enzyme
MLQDILSALGYKTAIFSSQNENWGGMINYIDSGNWNHIQHAGNYQGTVRVEYNRYQNEDTKAYAERMVKEGKSGKIDDSVTIDDVIQWLDTIDDDPYYLYINLQNSHAPYFVPENFTRQFLRDDEAVLKIDEGRLIELTIGQMKAAYFDSLNYIDFQISRLLQSLKERHQLNNTVIVITGDTATSFDEIENDGGHVTHILGNGGRLVEEAIKTPIIFYSAEHEQRDIEHVTQHVDVIPTVLDIMGLPPHPVYQGHSIFDDNYPLPAYAFITAQSPAAKENAVVANGWKVVYDELRNKVMVENLRNDIQSSRDMSQYLVVLNRWMSAQLDYYSDPLKMERLYPPVLRNVNFNCCIGIDEERGRP